MSDRFADARPRFIDASGKIVSRINPNKLIWYGRCGYWTDDWNHVDVISIPCCPACHIVGFQIEAYKWFQEAITYERLGHPKYHQFLLDNRELCFKKTGGLITAYETFRKTLPPTRT